MVREAEDILLVRLTGESLDPIHHILWFQHLAQDLQIQHVLPNGRRELMPINESAQGRLIFHLFASLAACEHDLIKARTQAGLAAARARGRMGGRSKGLSADAHTKAISTEALYAQGALSVGDIVKHLHISKATLYSYRPSGNTWEI